MGVGVGVGGGIGVGVGVGDGVIVGVGVGVGVAVAVGDGVGVGGIGVAVGANKTAGAGVSLDGGTAVGVDVEQATIASRQASRKAKRSNAFSSVNHSGKTPSMTAMVNREPHKSSGVRDLSPPLPTCCQTDRESGRMPISGISGR